jgi:cupin fold WbuC family metalloprotein
MRAIYSKVEPDVLLHVVNSSAEIGTRQDMCPAEQLLQMACFQLGEGKTFKSHKHIPKHVEHNITQESWIVVKGSVRAILYDLDDTVLEEVDLTQGDCSITFRGGHNYLCLEDDTLVYEAKTGPYLGVENDKVFLS